MEYQCKWNEKFSAAILRNVYQTDLETGCFDFHGDFCLKLFKTGFKSPKYVKHC